jgi:hypothetical protein
LIATERDVAMAEHVLPGHEHVIEHNERVDLVEADDSG